MRHQKNKKILGRPSYSRTALWRSLAVHFVMHQKIKTTPAKAKAVKPRIERLITKAKKDDLTVRRYLLSRLNDRSAVDKLIKEIAPKYRQRPGGYTRIVKLGSRAGDGSPMVQLELV